MVAPEAEAHHKSGFTRVYLLSSRPAWTTLTNPISKEGIEKGREQEGGWGKEEKEEV